MHIEICTFVGERSTQATDGFAGCRIGTRYQLRVTAEGVDSVRVKPLAILFDGQTILMVDRPGAVMMMAEYKK